MGFERLRIGLVVLVLVATGCGPESDPAPPADIVQDPHPTPNQLVQNFRTAYERRNAAAIASMLDPSFVMPLQPVAAARFPDLGDAVDGTEALRMHERLFGGEDVVDPTEQVIPAVLGVHFDTFERRGEWVQAAPGDPYPGTQRAIYDVVFGLDRSGVHSMLSVRGELRFHVAMRDTVLGGTPTTYCRLRAITDLTQDSGPAAKAAETICLGRLWGLWR